MQKTISIFTNSVGALFLALASALFLINLTSPADYVPPHDAIFLMPLRNLFWIMGGIAAVMALICFFSERSALKVFLLAWLSTNALVCQIDLFWSGCHGLTGFLGGFSYAFGISAKTTNTLINVVFSYLLIGSYASAAVEFLRKSTKGICEKPILEPKNTIQSDPRAPAYALFIKIACTTCDGLIVFPTNFFGTQISCPHCRATIILQKPANLKMNCTTCAGYLEFPDYALGQTLPCPHCQTEITLANPSSPQ